MAPKTTSYYWLVVMTAMLLVWASNPGPVMAAGAGEIEAANCGPPASFAPCLAAAKNARGRPTPPCCARVGSLIRTNPRCLCQLMMSRLAKQAGINPAIAVSIPKRCNIRKRPVGKKCGRYTVP